VKKVTVTVITKSSLSFHLWNVQSARSSIK